MNADENFVSIFNEEVERYIYDEICDHMVYEYPHESFDSSSISVSTEDLSLNLDLDNDVMDKNIDQDLSQDNIEELNTLSPENIEKIHIDIHDTILKRKVSMESVENANTNIKPKTKKQKTPPVIEFETEKMEPVPVYSSNEAQTKRLRKDRNAQIKNKKVKKKNQHSSSTNINLFDTTTNGCVNKKDFDYKLLVQTEKLFLSIEKSTESKWKLEQNYRVHDTRKDMTKTPSLSQTQDNMSSRSKLYQFFLLNQISRSGNPNSSRN